MTILRLLGFLLLFITSFDLSIFVANIIGRAGYEISMGVDLFSTLILSIILICGEPLTKWQQKVHGFGGMGLVVLGAWRAWYSFVCQEPVSVVPLILGILGAWICLCLITPESWLVSNTPCMMVTGGVSLFVCNFFIHVNNVSKSKIEFLPYSIIFCLVIIAMGLGYKKYARF